jgi:hypothetical protein
MRSFLCWIFFIVIGLLGSCLETENTDTSDQEPSGPQTSSPSSTDPLLIKGPFSKDVGDIIPVEKVRAWINNYLRESKSNQSEFLGKHLFIGLMEQKDCSGISFQYGIDERGEQVVVLVGLTSSGKTLSSMYAGDGIKCLEQCPDGTHQVFSDKSGQLISADRAKVLTESYKSKYPDNIRSHFFGTDLIIQLLNQRRCIGLSMQYALDDFGKQQLILTGVDERGMLMREGAFNSLYALPGDNGDESSPCPPYCSQ